MRKRCTLKLYCHSMDEFRASDDHAKGIVTWNFINLVTGKWTRSLVGYKASPGEKGVAFNHCPWCGFDYRPKFKSAAARQKRA